MVAQQQICRLAQVDTYATSEIGATGSFLTQQSQQSIRMSTWVEALMQTLSKYIDDVLLVKRRHRRKNLNLEDDLDSLTEEQEALDLQISNQRAVYVQKFTAMQTAVSSFRKTGEFLDNLIAS